MNTDVNKSTELIKAHFALANGSHCELSDAAPCKDMSLHGLNAVITPPQGPIDRLEFS